jgi:hypothetical protein
VLGAFAGRLGGWIIRISDPAQDSAGDQEEVTFGVCALRVDGFGEPSVPHAAIVVECGRAGVGQIDEVCPTVGWIGSPAYQTPSFECCNRFGDRLWRDTLESREGFGRHGSVAVEMSEGMDGSGAEVGPNPFVM